MAERATLTSMARRVDGVEANAGECECEWAGRARWYCYCYDVRDLTRRVEPAQQSDAIGLDGTVLCCNQYRCEWVCSSRWGRVLNRQAQLVSHIRGVGFPAHASPLRRGETFTLHRRVVDHGLE